MPSNIIEILIRGNDQSSKAIQSSIKGLGAMQSAMAAVRSLTVGLIGAGGFATLAKSAFDMGEDLLLASQKTNMSVESLSRLAYAANLDKVSFEDLAAGMKFLAKSMVEDDAAFKALGVRVKDNNGNLRAMEDVFMDAAEAMSKYEDGAGKTAAAVSIFGKAGDRLVPVLNRGRAGLRQMGEEAEKLGAAISEEQAKKLDAYGDAIQKVSINLKGLAATVITSKLWEDAGPLKIISGWIKGPLHGVGGSWEEDKKKPPLPFDPAAMKMAEEERKKLEADALQKFMKDMAARGDVLQDFYGDAAVLSKIMGEEDIKASEARRKITEETRLYAEEMRGTIDSIGVEGIEESLIDAWPAIQAMGKDVSRLHQQMVDDAVESAAAYDAAWQYVYKSAEGYQTDIQKVFLNSFDRLEDAIVNFTMTGKANFKSFADSAIASLMKIAIQSSITAPLYGLLGGFFPSIFPVGAKAAGGPVSGGVSYLVGERGPEVFVPRTAGTIIPNGGGGGGSQNIKVQVINESGTPMRVRDSRVSFDPQEMVVTLWMDAVARNRFGVRDLLGGA